jgi:hypothetical protein
MENGPLVFCAAYFFVGGVRTNQNTINDRSSADRLQPARDPNSRH